MRRPEGPLTPAAGGRAPDRRARFASGVAEPGIPHLEKLKLSYRRSSHGEADPGRAGTSVTTGAKPLLPAPGHNGAHVPQHPPRRQLSLGMNLRTAFHGTKAFMTVIAGKGIW